MIRKMMMMMRKSECKKQKRIGNSKDIALTNPSGYVNKLYT
jgi:hypothetical protein